MKARVILLNKKKYIAIPFEQGEAILTTFRNERTSETEKEAALKMAMDIWKFSRKNGYDDMLLFSLKIFKFLEEKIAGSI